MEEEEDEEAQEEAPKDEAAFQVGEQRGDNLVSMHQSVGSFGS